MRKKIYCRLLLILYCIVSGIISIPAQDQNSGVDYTTALQKKGQERINAFENYIKKYPPSSENPFTAYAYYWLARDYYNLKKFGNAIPRAEKALSLGVPEKQNEVELYLVLANSYGIQNNKDKAMNYADKAINLARAQKLATLLENAEAVKRELNNSGGETPKNKLTPVEKFQWLYDQKKYSEAVSAYNALYESDKKNHLNIAACAESLYNLERYDEALRKFEEAYNMKKIGQVAAFLAEIYELKGKRDSKYAAMAIDCYAEAGLLFGKERKPANQNAAVGKAKYLIGETFDYQRRYKEYQKKLDAFRAESGSARVDPKLIREKELELRRVIREIEKCEMEPPAYLTEKAKKLEKEIAELKAGGARKTIPPELIAEGEALEKIRKRIEAELETAIAKARKKPGM